MSGRYHCSSGIGVTVGVPGPTVGTNVDVAVGVPGPGVAVGVALGVPGPGVAVIVGVALGVPGAGVTVTVGVGVASGSAWIATEPLLVVPSTSTPLASPKLATGACEKSTGAVMIAPAAGVQCAVKLTDNRASLLGRLAMGKD